VLPGTLGQLLPHEPQLERLLDTLMHELPHSNSLAPWHSQSPDTHCDVPGQMLPHAPQFCSSVLGFTQVFEHHSWALVQASSQVPTPSQNRPLPQLVVTLA
jgi:hypothetical protein